MKRTYLDQNVYNALQDRLHFLFREFENIFVSFSGGKDSGLLLNLVLDFQKKYYPQRRIGLFHQDFEAQYSATTQYIERTFARVEKDVEPYWVCLPMATRTALSSYEMFWYPWDDTAQDAWVRPMPEHPYVIHLQNNPITTYRYKMHQEDLARQFCRWYRISHGYGKTVCLLGIRADESLQRYSGFLNKKHGYRDTCWISKQFKDVWTASPLYDWTTGDVWHANAIFHYDYNRLYDLFYRAGVPLDSQRVASPFISPAIASLHLYKAIDPNTWGRMVGRVNGANFAALYGRTTAAGWQSVHLPQGMTWESYMHFLLSTLPEPIRRNYLEKLSVSIRFWRDKGGCLSDETITKLQKAGIRIEVGDRSAYRTDKRPVRMEYLDDISLPEFSHLPTFKRICICILKNDHACKYMGFAPNKNETQRRKKIMEKYESLL